MAPVRQRPGAVRCGSLSLREQGSTGLSRYAPTTGSSPSTLSIMRRCCSAAASGLSKDIQAVWHLAPIRWALGAIFLVAFFCVSGPAHRRGKRWAELAATMGGLTFCSNCAQHAPSTPALTHVLRGTNPHSGLVECNHAVVPGVVVGAFSGRAAVSGQHLLDAGVLAVCLLGLARLAAGARRRPPTARCTPAC